MSEPMLRSVEPRRKRVLRAFCEKLFLCSAILSIFSLALITIFILWQGAPALAEIGIVKFLFGARWQPSAELFGIWPMVVASLASTGLTVLIAALIGVCAAVFLSEVAPQWLRRVVRPAVELLAGIPSVIYGLFGLVVIVPWIRGAFGGTGVSLLAAVIILTIMVLPTIISLSADALNAVPQEYREGSLALGVTSIQTAFRVTLPAARDGILSSIVLATGRAVGETMAVILISGNRPFLPGSLLDPVRTLTGNIAMEMGYAGGLHRGALFATGVILFVFIMILNGLFYWLNRRRG